VSVAYAIDSPYLDLVLVVYVDGAMWRSFAVNASGTSVVRLGGIGPGNHTVRIAITDGVKSVELGSVVVSVPEPAAAQPPPLAVHPPAFPVAALAVSAGGLGAAVAVGYLFMRRRANSAKAAASKDEQTLER